MVVIARTVQAVLVVAVTIVSMKKKKNLWLIHGKRS